MAHENKRGTIGIWLNPEKYKRFALSCKRFGFQISEILEDVMGEFCKRYPPEDPHQMQFITAPAYVVKPQSSPNIREEYQQGLLKWMHIFVCPGCGTYRHLTPESFEYLEKQGIRPSCHKCGKHMEFSEKAEVAV